jgi:asparagine synthase (glutamine-hydrolysing)
MIAGLVDFRGGPSDARLVARMIAPMQPRVLDTRGPVEHGSASLAFCGRRGARAPLDQPAIDGPSDCAVVFDGRLDNRLEIAAWLGLDRTALPSDARLVLAAYVARGTAAITRLAGDFAFAIWDNRERRLVLARDPLGIRQVCYAPVPNGLAFATDPRQLLEVPAVDRRPNLAFFGEWMAGWITHPSDTIYRGVHRVAAAHFVTADADGVRSERHWHVDVNRTLRYRDTAEYAQQFRELFASSVRARLQSVDRVAVALSGGVDSSAVTAMAAQVATSSSTELRAYHVAYPGIPQADEREYADLVAAAHTIPLAVLPGVTAPADAYQRAPRLLRDMAPGGVGATDVPFYEMIAADDCDLVLDGTGADEWFAGTVYATADLLREGRVLSALRHLRERAGHCCERHDFVTLAKGPVWAACPPALRRTIKRFLPARDIVPRIFRREFADSVHLADRITQPNYDDRFASVAAGAVYRDATCQLNAYNWHEDVRLASAFGLDMSAPFQDRALVEFALALPEEQRWSLGRAKRVIRDGMRDLMPAQVLGRDDKGNGSEAQFAELRRFHAVGALDPASLAEAGVADRSAVDPIFSQMCDRHACGDKLWEIDASQLWMLFCAESAWRALFIEGDSRGLTRQ